MIETLPCRGESLKKRVSLGAGGETSGGGDGGRYGGSGGDAERSLVVGDGGEGVRISSQEGSGDVSGSHGGDRAVVLVKKTVVHRKKIDIGFWFSMVHFFCITSPLLVANIL